MVGFKTKPVRCHQPLAVDKTITPSGHSLLSAVEVAVFNQTGIQLLEIILLFQVVEEI